MHPIKSLTIAFHDAKGLTPPEPKQQALPQQPPISNSLGSPQSPSPTPQTKLDPLSEALFQGWGHANGLDPSAHDPASKDNHYDFRGMFKQSNGQVLPLGQVKGASDIYNRLMATKPDYASMGIQHPTPTPIPSHNTLQAPGIPSVEQANAQKMGVLQSEGADPNSDPLSSLRRMFGQ